jgi:hypothetical protein
MRLFHISVDTHELVESSLKSYAPQAYPQANAVIMTGEVKVFALIDLD